MNLQLPLVSQTCWIDMTADTTVDVRVSVTSGALEALASEDVSKLSQQDFVNKFAFIDLPELLRASKVTTYQELQAEFPRLYQLQYATPPVFDPNDPGARRTYRLRVSALFCPTIDLEAALRRLVQARRALNLIRPRLDEYDGGDVRATDAWMAIFPSGAVDPNVISEQDVEAVFAAEGFVAAFEPV
jgi:hypothetical protein